MGVKKAELFEKIDRKNKYAIIFVHGLHGDPNETWRRFKGSKTLPELFALDEKLDCIDVYSFGYQTNLIVNYDFKVISKLLDSEIKARLEGKNIIFIAHSMGGLVVQQYLIDQYEENNITAIERVKGIAYMAVPLNGSSLANLASRFAPFHKQLKSLVENNPMIQQLREKWVKYVFRGGHESLPEHMRSPISQLAIYGVRDSIVTKQSASPFHIDADVIASDSGHRNICKMDMHSTDYKHLSKFILDNITSQKISEPMIIHMHGWDKQGFKEDAHYPLDWTKHFNISASPRILPSPEIWATDIQAQIDFVSREWSEKWAIKGGLVRVYGKVCLTGALLLGSKLSVTKGIKMEVDHYGVIWSADQIDPSFSARPRYSPGNSSESRRAVLILSVTKDIQNEVEQHLSSTYTIYNKLVNLLPPSEPGHTSIINSKQALSFAFSVKKEIEQLKNEGVREIYLYLNAPLSVALFVGHRLTASCPIQTFEYDGVGYSASCKL